MATQECHHTLGALLRWRELWNSPWTGRRQLSTTRGGLRQERWVFWHAIIKAFLFFLRSFLLSPTHLVHTKYLLVFVCASNIAVVSRATLHISCRCTPLVGWFLQVGHYQPWLQLDANHHVKRLQQIGQTHLQIPYPDVQTLGPDTGVLLVLFMLTYYIIYCSQQFQNGTRYIRSLTLIEYTTVVGGQDSYIIPTRLAGGIEQFFTIIWALTTF